MFYWGSVRAEHNSCPNLELFQSLNFRPLPALKELLKIVCKLQSSSKSRNPTFNLLVLASSQQVVGPFYSQVASMLIGYFAELILSRISMLLMLKHRLQPISMSNPSELLNSLRVKIAVLRSSRGRRSEDRNDDRP